MEAPTDLAAGHVLGRYQLLMPIAAGGMAMVWAARLHGTRGFQKLVAVKMMLPTMSTDPHFERMFLAEASLASKIRHPHVAEVLDLGEEAGLLYIVMEWVDGDPLSTILRAAAKRQQPLPIPVAVRIVMQACAGLHAAHELRGDDGQPLGLVHRDVSPQNVLVSRDGVSKLVDFGIAKVTARERQEGPTNAGVLKGKTLFMAPEQVMGEGIDRRADIFALGTLLYLMTTGAHPFKGDNDVETLSKLCRPDDVVSPSVVTPNYPPLLAKAVLRALAKDPAKRFSSANEMLRAIDQALPPSSRLSSDDSVAACIGELLVDGQRQRAAALAAAIRAADAAQAARGEVKPVSFTTTQLLTAFQSFRGYAMSGTAPNAISGADRSGATFTAIPARALESAWRQRVRWAVGGGAAAAVVALGVVGYATRAPNANGRDVLGPAVSPVAIASMTPTAASSTVASSAATANNGANDAGDVASTPMNANGLQTVSPSSGGGNRTAPDSAASAARHNRGRGGGHAVTTPTPKSDSVTTKAPKSASPFASPIRNPGF